MGDLSTNFSRAEFRCKCGQCEPVDPPMELVDALQVLRDYVGVPVKIHSGHRCEAYNKKVGGALHSKHLTAEAADFTIEGYPPSDVQGYLLIRYAGRYGIGRYDTFTHLDVRKGMSRWDNRK